MGRFEKNVLTPVPLSGGIEAVSTYKTFSMKNIALRAEPGDAAILDMPLDEKKQLKSLVLKTIANDVVIGLMALTLAR